MKCLFTFIILLCGCILVKAQNINYKTIRVAVSDTVIIDKAGINPHFFSVQSKTLKPIDTTAFKADFSKGILILNKPVATDTLIVSYLEYPKFLTKVYRQLDDNIILNSTKTQQQLYTLTQDKPISGFTPFSGLNTSGSISRGVTIGNNQNAVLNSELDLQITGKLSDNVSLRASIQDANIPLQESGYSQRLDEFDQVFVELFSDRWRIRAGDIDLENTTTNFANFSKRLQGLSLQATLGDSENKTEIFAAGALARGQFARSQFTAQEGNQGPYKLTGQNNELYVLVVSGSETVYVNGIALERGESNDYVIDYNAGEITFNATFPITSEMRITVDYQYSERHYSRLVAHGGAQYDSEKLQLGVQIYSESDAKNNPLQQNLSPEQVAVLKTAGDNRALMTSSSAISEPYNENKILYKKEIINGEEVFVFSNNPEDELFAVTFSLVGDNLGDYVISSTNAINNIYEYVPPIGGLPQGNYAPVFQLVAPTKLQMAVVNGKLKATEKTTVAFEVAGSQNDLNLFSDIDNYDNNGFAGTLMLEQNLIKNDSLWNLDAVFSADYIHKDFKTIEPLYNPEFNRDWNLENPMGNQGLYTFGVNLKHYRNGIANYRFQQLNYSENFRGGRHAIEAYLKLNKLTVQTNSSFLKAQAVINQSTFLRSYNQAVYNLNKKWIGTRLAFESNEQQIDSTQNYTPLSQRYAAYEIFTGIGDSTKVFAEMGYKFRTNDSLRNNQLTRVNHSHTYYLDTRIIQNKNTDLQWYANYRNLVYDAENIADEQTLNSRLQYRQDLFNKIVQLQTVFETQSGNIARQDFTYVAVEAGQGTYTWIDYNNNNIQELEEFEVAPFSDQGEYVRVLLPNQLYVKTHQNKFSQVITFQPQQWSDSQSRFKKIISHFYNQTTYLIDEKTARSGKTFNINPFKADDNLLGLQRSFSNNLFFNRGKQRYTTSYTYLSNTVKSFLSIGFLESRLNSHQLQFTHKLGLSWLANMLTTFSNTKSESENYASKNFTIDALVLQPKWSYLLNDNTRLDIFYEYTEKTNTISDKEHLKQQNYGLSFSYAPQKSGQVATINGAFNYFLNNFEGKSNTPVAYQMLEGLQPGRNYTWHLLVQKKLTKFLDINLSYFGRKTKTSKTIHNGVIQLKAYF